jgi:hypothetical protein
MSNSEAIAALTALRQLCPARQPKAWIAAVKVAIAAEVRFREVSKALSQLPDVETLRRHPGVMTELIELAEAAKVGPDAILEFLTATGYDDQSIPDGRLWTLLYDVRAGLNADALHVAASAGPNQGITASDRAPAAQAIVNRISLTAELHELLAGRISYPVHLSQLTPIVSALAAGKLDQAVVDSKLSLSETSDLPAATSAGR